MSNEIKIRKQVEVAGELLAQLKIICPWAILAGGAPRDWHFGQPANDLDFYISLDPASTMSFDNQQIESVFSVLPGKLKKLKSEYDTNQNPMYRQMNSLRRIYYYEYYGIPFQIIRLHTQSDVWKVVDNMDCSICKAWWNGSVHIHNDFKLSLVSDIIFLNEDYEWTDYHPKKMAERFDKIFVRATKKQAEEAALDKLLTNHEDYMKPILQRMEKYYGKKNQ